MWWLEWAVPALQGPVVVVAIQSMEAVPILSLKCS